MKFKMLLILILLLSVEIVRAEPIKLTPGSRVCGVVTHIERKSAFLSSPVVIELESSTKERASYFAYANAGDITLVATSFSSGDILCITVEKVTTAVVKGTAFNYSLSRRN